MLLIKPWKSSVKHLKMDNEVVTQYQLEREAANG